MPHVAPWYRREDYERFREIMEDGDRFPADFDEWEKAALKELSDVKREGITIEPVLINPDDLVVFCMEKRLSCGREARYKLAVARAAGIR
jgi:hypothetical protein